MLRQEARSQLDVEEFGNLVLETCYDVANQHWKRLINANESYIARCLSDGPI